MTVNVTDLDISVIRGPDRRITRFISQWVWRQVDEDGHPLFAGIRYRSRTNSAWECWAIYNDIPLEEVARQPILATNPQLRTIEELYGIRVH